MNIWDVNADNIVISKLLKTKTNSKYLIAYLDKAVRPLVLILPKMEGYIKTFKVKDSNKDKSNKLMSLHISYEKLLEKYKTIWNKIESLKNIALPVDDDRYIKSKIKTFSDKAFTNFPDLDDIEFESVTAISIDYLLVYETKYYLQVYLNNWAYKITNKRQIIFMTIFLKLMKISSYECCITIELI